MNIDLYFHGKILLFDIYTTPRYISVQTCAFALVYAELKQVVIVNMQKKLKEYEKMGR